MTTFHSDQDEPENKAQANWRKNAATHSAIAEHRTKMIDIELDLIALGDELANIFEEGEAGMDVTERLDAAAARFDEQLKVAEGKRDAYAKFVMYIKSQIESRKEQVKMMQKEVTTLENIERFIKKYAVRVMETLGVKKLEGKQFKLKSHTNSVHTLVILDPNAIPARYYREEIVVKLDRDALKKALVDGTETEIPRSVAYVERDSHLRIS